MKLLPLLNQKRRLPLSKTIDSQDVTGEYTDLESRLRIWKLPKPNWSRSWMMLTGLRMSYLFTAS